MNDQVLRQSLLGMLRGDHAHVSMKRAVSGVDPEKRNVRPAPLAKSVWEYLEHMRLAQEDILRYTLDPDWKSPAFPQGYWPVEIETLTEDQWHDTSEAFFEDLEDIVGIALNTDMDLTSPIPHAPVHTYLREILLVADHNAYHAGQIVQTRKLIGDWS